jgi:phosphoenolpyruvate carboxylase
MQNIPPIGTQQFTEKVALKYQLYNSLLTNLPFHKIEKTGILLSVLLNECEEGYKLGKSPEEILNKFLEKHTNITNEAEQLDLFFRFIQYVERQVVLFDALEEAAYTSIQDVKGKNTLAFLWQQIADADHKDLLEHAINNFNAKLVLTAHPTQFYPGTILGIITDLSQAVNQNNVSAINTYLQQLGKTPFFKQDKPTPLDEATSLIWYLENVFYTAFGNITYNIYQQLNNTSTPTPIEIGFWPGGDRDGNPFVNCVTTLKVANELKESIIKCYYLDIRKLKKRLTFKNVLQTITQLEHDLYEALFLKKNIHQINDKEIIKQLQQIKTTLLTEHNGLFATKVDMLIAKVTIFGLHFATLDIRQEASIHTQILLSAYGETYAELNAAQKITWLTKSQSHFNNQFNNDVLKDTYLLFDTIKEIQKTNGPKGCYRYIISQCKSAINILEVYHLFLQSGWQPNQLTIDIVPLFETIDDLENAPQIMEKLYNNAIYFKHLMQRNHKQTIMLGFSDGTKDGGYLTANFAIYNAKEALYNVAKKYGISVVFFDGRGGPPSRGGGKTNQFYASMDKNITNNIQLTIQGQTISSNFGTVAIAQHNTEQLMHAGLSNALFSQTRNYLSDANKKILHELATQSHNAYQNFKNHELFLDYLSHVTPIKYYSETNIASRPTKRNNNITLAFNELRAIPYVGAWAQIKQNVSGFYGVGTALAYFEKQGRFAELKHLYSESLFFKTLMDNCEMAMKKCFMPLTMYLAKDEKYAPFWNLIYQEFETTKRLVLALNGNTGLMQSYPIDAASITLREKIILPLLTIQQFALLQVRKINTQQKNDQYLKNYKKIIIRASFGIINAGRNAS